MMKTTTQALLAAALLTCATATAQKTPADYVNPFIGTALHGHTYPGATVPQGAVQLSPDTKSGGWDHCSGYHYDDPSIYGFSHTNLSGTGCADLGDILFHPDTKAGTPAHPYQPATYSHSNEQATPGYYTVTLDNGIRAELTATTYCGLHRYTYPAGSTPNITIDMTWGNNDEEHIRTAQLERTTSREITGMRITDSFVENQHIYFVAQFSCDITSATIFSNGKALNAQRAQGDALLMALTLAEPTVTVKVGISAVSYEGARENLQHDTGSAFNFDQLRTQAHDTWDKALGAITIDDPSDAVKTKLYTALYHCLIVPNTMSDANGEYRASDNTIQVCAPGHRYVSTLSFWDIYRAWNPLMSLLDAPLCNDIVRSSLSFYQHSGELPIWPLSSGETGCMIGYHSAAIISEYYRKGFRDYDTNLAIEAMQATANTTRKALDLYVAKHFIPVDRHSESTSCTLEYCYDDWAIAQFAKAIGRDDVYREYTARAYYYQNVFDSSTRFFRGRNSDGNWETPFDPNTAGKAYTEATPWQYRFAVQHDVNGLVQLFGGKKQFISALDSMYTIKSADYLGKADISGIIGQYAHGNEPSHHFNSLYSYVGQPWKTAEHNIEVVDKFYGDGPDGLCGNEDCGQMSAWYVMTSLGIYPTCPASAEYVLSTPLVRQASITLNNGKTLTIIAGDHKKTPYVAKVELNGKPLNRAYVTHDELMQGGTLRFTLSKKPTKWATAPEAAPSSQTIGQVVSVPTIGDNLFLFPSQGTTAKLVCATPGAQIHYTTDGSEPTPASAVYTAPIALSNDTHIRAIATKQGYAPSMPTSIHATKAVHKPATQPAATQPGTHYQYFEGQFSRVAQLDATTPLKQGIIAEPDITGAPIGDHFGYIFSGLINVPEDGIWTFVLASDDGSTLTIDGDMVVDSDGSHSAQPAAGRVALKKGLHRYTLRYFEDYEGQALSWGWQAPSSTEVTPIPASALCVETK